MRTEQTADIRRRLVQRHREELAALDTLERYFSSCPNAGESVTPTTKGTQMAEAQFVNVQSMGDLNMYAVYFGGRKPDGTSDRSVPVRILRVISQALVQGVGVVYYVINPGFGRDPVIATEVPGLIDFSLDCERLAASELTGHPGTTAHVYIEAMKAKTIK